MSTKDQQDELKLIVFAIGLSDLAIFTGFYFNDFLLLAIGITMTIAWFISTITFLITLKKQDQEATLP